MDKENGQLPLLELAERYFGEIEHLQPVIEFFQENPELFDSLSIQLDFAVNQLNSCLKHGVPEKLAESMPNVLKIQALLGEKKELPELYDLETDESSNNLKTGVKVFRKTQKLIEGGDWSFTEDIKDEVHLAAAMMLEMYGQAMEQKEPELSGNGVTTMLAVEEVLALYHDSSDLYQAVYEQGWYSTDEGFSQPLVDIIEQRHSSIE